MDKDATKEAVQAALGEALKKMTSGQTPQLAAAYVAFWADCGNVAKDATNPHFKNTYASLEAVLAIVKPLMAKHGLALLQAPGPVRDHNMTLHSVLVHSSGQSWAFNTELPLGKNEGPQPAGSVITYARRYFLLAIGGIAPVDDDGEAASGEEPVAVESTKKLDKGMEAFKANEGEKPADAVKRFTAEYKDRVSATGDQELVDTYLAKRKALKGG